MPQDLKYVEALQYVQHCTFICAVDELEGLVMQCMFELSKANLAGTGYKMRKHISKALTRRSMAIRSALERYNRLAPRQQPPCPKLDYTEVIGYTTLGEFSLLKHSRFWILDKLWTVKLNREMAMKLASEMQLLYAERRRVNNVHRRQLQEIYKLEGYTGWIPIGGGGMMEEVEEPDDERDEGMGEEEVVDDATNDEAIRLDNTLNNS
ncbi:hypothetical protein HYDPIDRAFT_175258 [Hydnomerulius pinastri MD-312]|uniref:Uncharacterized protein n=1 Tax=Hydnomerulius pinastri MD-312 TaxID=994086 RepID=A0A0C9WB62_9AGAM|nr:hypothetical protein HYDPIDRAFT_175258 [Hydnomerulius pinastri MD-312]